MMVANSFDLWQKDAFFSAAEEVQESADIMESVYRTWVRVRERKEGLQLDDLDELRRELQTVLGTAKWQLEEFERAIRLSHGHRSEDNTTTRHRQFVSAIEDQICRVETELRDSLKQEGKQPLRWVHLDEEERDDLAAFLSGTPGSSQSTKHECVELSKNTTLMGNQLKRKDANLGIDACFKEVVTFNKDSKYVVELEAKEIPGTRDDISCQTERLTGQRRTWSSPNFSAWKIVIADEDKQKKTMESSVESTTKGKGFKSCLWRQKSSDHLQTKGVISGFLDVRGINKFTQLFGQFRWFPRQLQGAQYTQFSRSLRIMLMLMLTIFLIVKQGLVINKVKAGSMAFESRSWYQHSTALPTSLNWHLQNINKKRKIKWDADVSRIPIFEDGHFASKY